MEDFTITIENNSGRPHNYFVFAEAPKIDGARDISTCVYSATGRRMEQSQIRVKAAVYSISGSKFGQDVSVGSSRRENGSFTVVNNEGR